MKIWQCQLCECKNKSETETASAAKLHLKGHLGKDYTPELDKAIGTIPGKRIAAFHIDFDDGWMSKTTTEFYLPDGRVWALRFMSDASSKYQGTPA